ncbi:FAD-dependent oxidoreductase [Nocardia sp. NPDC019395]|uniref:FAD-dependent oxidoreductase n=1 Tax=Nocardia sp. NPDC019395 TaxID=3154686 RepID=UPI0033ECF758
MPYVITAGCCNDAACVEVCPVDAIRPRPEDPEFRTAEQLYIDPDTCIDCSACMFACPVSAVHDAFELPEDLSEYLAINAGYFEAAPIDRRYFDIGPVASATAPVAARVAVIGAGPAACYAVAELCRTEGIQITVFDRLPTPFGLVRSGVAPDHSNTKQIGDVFQSVLAHPNVTCYFNVEVGRDIGLDDLRRSHHAVIYAAGADGDRMLGIDGEELAGSCSAREFVSWYNGHPDFADLRYDLIADTAVVVGNGNVALDVARTLVGPIAALETTDMADHAIAALRGSAVETVVIAARRGPAEAACTSGELSELCRLPGVAVAAIPEEVARLSRSGYPAGSAEARKVEIFGRLPDARRPAEAGVKRVVFRFGAVPLRINGQERVDSISFGRAGVSHASTETIECGLVIRSVGYTISRFAGLPFDDSTRTIANRAGRVVQEKSGEVLPGLFCVGWAKRGPSGVIGTNKVCARETVGALLDDLNSGGLPEPDVEPGDIGRMIRSRRSDVIDMDDWRTIDAEERKAGRAAVPPKPRRKLVSLDRMLRIVNGGDPGADDFGWPGNGSCGARESEIKK